MSSSSTRLAAPSSPRTTALAILGLVTVLGLSAWLRGPGFTQGGFASHDVAAMLHSSMVLLDGGLPYVDTLELKAPGTFYLGAWLCGGTDIATFQIWANLWGLATLGVVAALAWRLWGPAAAVVAAGLYALHDAHLDSMDANYVTWAQLPLVAGVGAALVAPRAATRRRQLAWWAAAGLLAGAAVLLKRPAAAGVLVVGVSSLWAAPTDRTSRRARVLAVGAGLVASHVPIAVHYALAGQLGALVDGYLWNRWGLRYVAGGAGAGAEGASVEVGDALVEGVLATVHFLVLPLGLA
ncbi:MAG: glycosyltransferase family 39 protein, partial [Myxococcales bacterium]|nr:glycosyltransferase family 39 protein [Myxococcales bacterium]